MLTDKYARITEKSSMNWGSIKNWTDLLMRLQLVRFPTQYAIRFQPDIVLFINTPKDILTVEDIKYANRFSKTVYWFVDGNERM